MQAAVRRVVCGVVVAIWAGMVEVVGFELGSSSWRGLWSGFAHCWVARCWVALYVGSGFVRYAKAWGDGCSGEEDAACVETARVLATALLHVRTWPLDVRAASRCRVSSPTPRTCCVGAARAARVAGFFSPRSRAVSSDLLLVLRASPFRAAPYLPDGGAHALEP